MAGVYKLGFIGDSITEGHVSRDFPPALAAVLIGEALGLTVNATNRGLSGTTTLDWAPGQSYLVNAKSAFASAGCTEILIMLGANDCKSANNVAPATYGTRLAAIVNDLVSAGYVVILNYPTWANWDVGDPLHLPGYCDEIDALCNGTTIKQGDVLAYSYFDDNPGELSDGVHPTTTGSNSLARLWSDAVVSLWQYKQRRPRLAFRGGKALVR